MDSLINVMDKCSLEEEEDKTIHTRIENININPSQWLIDIIKNQKEKEINANIWDNSSYKDIATLESNNVGNVGEMLFQKICVEAKIESDIDGSKTKQVGGGKIGDGKIKNKSVEIKTARVGASYTSFQHELGEHPWNTDYIIFVDITPKDVYLTIFKNFTEEQYKQKEEFKCEPYFPTKSITQRKGIGNFKLDTTIKINEICVKNGYSIKIKNDNIKEIGEFINKTII